MEQRTRVELREAKDLTDEELEKLYKDTKGSADYTYGFLKELEKEKQNRATFSNHEIKAFKSLILKDYSIEYNLKPILDKINRILDKKEEE